MELLFGGAFTDAFLSSSIFGMLIRVRLVRNSISVFISVKKGFQKHLGSKNEVHGSIWGSKSIWVPFPGLAKEFGLQKLRLEHIINLVLQSDLLISQFEVTNGPVKGT